MRATHLVWLLGALLACNDTKEEGDDDDDGAPPLTETDADGDGLVAAEDCDDDDASVGGPTEWYADRDDDNYGDADNPYDTLECEKPDGYVASDTDCDDLDDEVNPGRSERCDGKDNDCDGLADDEDDDVSDADTWYADADDDDYGDPKVTAEACIEPDGYVDDDQDCDDSDSDINPDGTETCNWADDDCDGETDEDLATYTFYYDGDGDGYGLDDETLVDCGAPSDEYADEAGDCDDEDADANPGEDEICNDIDDDCDGDTDEDDASDAATWYADADSDTYGDPDTTTTSCEQPTGYVDNSEDCDDTSADNSPVGTEVCDEADNDCDGDTDEDDAVDALTWYLDGDGDGYGDEDSTTAACDEPTGYGPDYGDCDDSDDGIYPGAHEVCADGTDSDCDGDDGSCGEVDLGDAEAKILGIASSDKAGSSVSGGGDVDGDGTEDIVVGARTADGAAADMGSVYLVLGAPSGETSLSDAEATVTGSALEDYLGTSAAIVGDVDADGYDDVLMGAPSQDDGGIDAGAAFLFLGPFSGSMSVSSADSALTGENAGDAAGTVAAAGDTDGDGYADFIIGAPAEDTGGTDSGCAYLLLGPVSTDLDLSLANAQLIGEADEDSSGYRVGTAGDHNADGSDDILVTALYDDTADTDAGAIYVLNGPVRRSKYLSSADAKLTGEAADDAAGRSLSGGDVDNDGYDDNIVGAPYEDSAQGDGGATYVMAGPVTGSLSLSTSVGKLVGESDDDSLGISVAIAGDIDGDGNADLLMGASQEDAGGASAGAAYVVFGPASGTIDLFDTDAKLIGEASGDAAGISVSTAGDIDGDNKSDILVGATGDDTAASAAGAVYLLLGSEL